MSQIGTQTSLMQFAIATTFAGLRMLQSHLCSMLIMNALLVGTCIQLSDESRTELQHDSV